MCLTSLAAITAAINSSLGRVSFLSGETRDLAITSANWLPLQMYMAAPYYFILASEKTCSVLSSAVATIP